jgi:adenylate cyclase
MSDDSAPIADLNSQANLSKLLDELAEHPERIEDIERRINEIFLEDRTVLILDMSGFTRATHRGDIISFLLMINQMQRLALPVIDNNTGLLVRAEHDNLTCIFDSVEDAIRASKDITERLESANVILPSDKELYVSIGIGYGSILNVENQAIYGNEVNLASKLGEDIGGLGEVMLTENAFERIESADVKCEKHVVNLSGINLTYYKVL